MTSAGTDKLTDLVVVVPGIMGSTLYHGDRLVWGTSPTTVLAALVSRLKVIIPCGDLRDDDATDPVRPGELVSDVQVIPGLWTIQMGYTRLLSHLESVLGRQASILRNGGTSNRNGDTPNTGLLTFPYDWRLSNGINGRRLAKALQGALERWRDSHPSRSAAQVTFICHSMGGLVVRWFTQREGGATMTRRIVTIGTPHRGALRALEQLVNGAYLGIGPFQRDFSEFVRSLASTYELLPTYACLEPPRDYPPRPDSAASDSSVPNSSTTKLLTIAEYLDAGHQLPGLETELVKDGLRFATKLNDSPDDAPTLYPIVGTHQPTYTTANITNGEKLTCCERIDGDDEAGDGTVPRLAATPQTLATDSPTIHWTAEKHVALPHNRSVLDQLEGILTAQPVQHRRLGVTELSVRVDELATAGTSVPLAAEVPGETTPPLQATVLDRHNRLVTTVALQAADGHRHGEIPALAPGIYKVVVEGRASSAGRVAPVTSLLAILDPTPT